MARKKVKGPTATIKRIAWIAQIACIGWLDSVNSVFIPDKKEREESQRSVDELLAELRQLCDVYADMEDVVKNIGGD